MHRDICRRIERLEAEGGISPNRPPPIILLHSDQVEHDGRKWQREPEEGKREFHGRIAYDLYEAGYPSPIFLCFGQKPRLPPLGPAITVS
jgi:hypothetical protein